MLFVRVTSNESQARIFDFKSFIHHHSSIDVPCLIIGIIKNQFTGKCIFYSKVKFKNTPLVPRNSIGPVHGLEYGLPPESKS